MTHKFGIKNKFEIQYNLVPNQGEGIFCESWGSFKMLVNGVDICEYTDYENTKDYTWNLYFIIEWLCEKMQYIIGYDPFPLPIQADTVTNLIEKANEFVTDDDVEEYLWFQAKSLWTSKHSWFSNRGGSVLTNTYFRRVDEQVEISWCNDFWFEKGIKFVNPRGCFIMPKSEFKKVIFDFLKNILNELETKTSCKADEEKLLEWKKAIQLFEP